MQVSVIETPSATKASTARCSSETIHSVWRSWPAFVKSVPRGSVMVGMRTWRCPSFMVPSFSSHITPACPRLSVSAMMWACVTRHEIGRAEEIADRDLVFEAQLGDGPRRAGQDGLFV